LLQQMEQLRLEAQRLLQRGERPTEEMERKLDTLLSQIQSKTTYQRLLVAQENFDKVMSKVNDWILEGIEKGATSSIITL
ncbi:MAG TPA: YlbF family regulator, partial [Gemmatimonadaceae bacterium]|nr:YlbF family regulator [Gemmatimonadaceae bacterium]